MDEQYWVSLRFRFRSKTSENSPLHDVSLALLFLWTVFLLASSFCMAGAMNGRSEYNQKIIDLCVSRVSGEELRWKLKADEAIFQNNGERAILRQINLHYSLPPGQDVIMRGDRAEVDFFSHLISLQGGIKAESQWGLSLETETLIWNGRERLILTQDWVTIKRPNLEMSGQGLEADLDLEKIKIKADAKTVIY